MSYAQSKLAALDLLARAEGKRGTEGANQVAAAQVASIIALADAIMETKR